MVTALHTAVSANNLAEVEKIIREESTNRSKDNFEAYLDEQDDSMAETALHIAVRNDNEKIITALLKANADCRVWNSNGHSPLDLTVTLGRQKALKVFIEDGANVLPFKKDANGISLIFKAVEGDQLEIAETLITQKQYKVTLGDPLYAAVKQTYDNALPLWKNGSKDDKNALKKSLHLANNVAEAVLSKDKQEIVKAVKALDDNALNLAQGKPSQWKKFTGALIALIGIAALALSIAGIPFTGGASLVAMYVATSLVTAAGVTLFGSSLQRGFSKDLSTLSNVARLKC